MPPVTPAAAPGAPPAPPPKGFPRRLARFSITCSQCHYEQILEVPDPEEFLKCCVCDHTVPMVTDDFLRFVESERYLYRHKNAFPVALIVLAVGIVMTWQSFYGEIRSKIIGTKEEYKGDDPSALKERIPWYEGGTLVVTDKDEWGRPEKSKPDPKPFLYVSGGKLTVKEVRRRTWPDNFLYPQEVRAYMRLGYLAATRQREKIPDFAHLKEGADGEQAVEGKNVTELPENENFRALPEEDPNAPPGPKRDLRELKPGQRALADGWLQNATWVARQAGDQPGAPPVRIEPLPSLSEDVRWNLYYPAAVPQSGEVPPSEIRRSLKAKNLAANDGLRDDDFSSYERLEAALRALGEERGFPLLKQEYQTVHDELSARMEQISVLYQLPLLREEWLRTREIRAITHVPVRYGVFIALFLGILSAGAALHRWKHKRGHLALIFGTAAAALAFLPPAFLIRKDREVRALRLESGLKIRNNETARPIRTGGLEEAPMVKIELVGANDPHAANHMEAGDPVPVPRSMTVGELVVMRRDIYAYGRGLAIALAAILGIAFLGHRRIRDWNYILPLVAFAAAVSMSISSMEKFYMGEDGTGPDAGASAAAAPAPRAEGEAPPDAERFNGVNLDDWRHHPDDEMRHLVDEFHKNTWRAVGICLAVAALYIFIAEYYRRVYYF